MKKTAAMLFSMLLVSMMYMSTTYAAETVTFDDGTTWTCDQSFAPKTLRYGYYYGFFDTFTNQNASTYNNYINTYNVQYKNANYLGVGGAFGFSPEIKALSYTLSPGQTAKILSTGDENWRVLRHPGVRSTGSGYDFMIGYRIGYDTSNNYPDATDDSYHVECQPYQVTWCGDGIIDASYESCDDGASNGLPGKCAVSCDSILPPNEKTTCDQVFPAETLRYGNDVYFYDTYSNLDSFAHRLKKFDILFTEPYDYNLSTSLPTFDWTQSFKNVNYVVNAGASNQKVIESTTPYTIRGVPPSRSSTNLVVKYRFYSENATPTSTVTTHMECQPYEISWCGDGVVESQYNETCDPAAPGQSLATCDPVTCNPPIIPTSSFDLSIKKYAKSEDVFASIDNTENFNYTIIVRNNGTGAVTGVTTVRDRLPGPIVLRAIPSGNDWTCTGTVGGADFTCTTNKSYAANTEFDVITVPVQVTSLVFRPEGYMNYAYVHNPNEATGKRCNADASMPNPALGGGNGETPTAVCNEDKNNFDPATINPPNPNGFDLRLKKFVNGDDESSPARTGSTINYTFTVQNLGLLTSSGVTRVTDTDFPTGVTITSIATTQGEWTCTQLSITGFACTTSRALIMGEFATPITLTATVGASMGVGTYRNVACLSNPFDPNESQPLDPSTGKYKVNNCDPAEIVIVPPGSFDLSIKKYVADITTGTPQRDGDHQTTNDGTDVDRDILTINQGGSVRYRFIVRNEGTVTATGTTTVEDTLPNGFTITGSVAGTGWTCTSGTNGNRSFMCNRTENLAVGAGFPEIVVSSVSDTAILAGEYSNTATVKNPGDTNPANNTDPANVEVLVFGGPACGSLTGSITGAVSPGTAVNYTCIPLNYTGAIVNLEYQINCGTSTGSWTSSNTGSCTASSSYSTSIPVTCGVRDRTNSALVFTGSFARSCATTLTTGGGPGGGGSAYVGKICVNNIASCATYSSIQACMAAGVPQNLCYSADTAGLNLCQNQPLSCSGGGGGGGGGCGNGVLELGEECDVVGAQWCKSCKLDLTTNPGANPITDLWMNIPVLSNAKMGYSWLDGIPGKIPFNANGVVVGVGGRVFTLPDTVGFGIKTKYAIPLIIEVEKKICLQSSGSNINSNTICTTFGDAKIQNSVLNSGIGTFRRYDGKSYIIIGRGDYQIPVDPATKPAYPAPLRTFPAPTADQINAYNAQLSAYNSWNPYQGFSSNSSNNITLFRGSQTYTMPAIQKLNTAFVGKTPGTDAEIVLISCATGGDCSPTAVVDLAHLPIRVSSAIVGTAGTPVNRSIEEFVKTKPGNIVSSFLNGLSSSTTTSNVTTSNANIGNIAVNGAKVGNIVADELSDIPTLNGNPNIRAIKGNLVINCPSSNSSFVMDGVRTIIVQGNITINCNTSYANANSSWAWIAKEGNIQIYNGTGTPNTGAVSNIAGVYVAIGDTSTTGKFEPIGSATTNAILKIEGSLYGNANPLFNSRLYARGTNAYEILTTGTIITYSNRALVNPPPLLSQYLNNYSVERVVK